MTSSEVPSVLPHLPTEVWEYILSEVIHVPLLLDSVCPEGISFVDFLQRRDALDDYLMSETQRRLLLLVCTSWRAWADSMPFRYLDLSPNDGWVPEYSRSRNVLYCPALEPCLSFPTQWEILCLVHRSSLEVESTLDQLNTNISLHPKLCALSIYMMQIGYEFRSPLFTRLPLLLRLTSLKIHINPTGPPYNGPVVILPALQLLEIVETGAGLPFSCLRLPALRYFAISTRYWRRELDEVLEQANLLRALHVISSLAEGPTPRFDYASRIEELLVGYRDGTWDIAKARSLKMFQNLKMVIIDGDKRIYDLLRWATHPRPPQLQVIRVNYPWEVFCGIDLGPVARCAEQAGVRCEDFDRVEIGEHIKERESM